MDVLAVEQVARAAGIHSGIQPSALLELNQLTQERLRALLDTAKLLMRRGHGERLSAAHVNDALRVHNVPGLMGYSAPEVAAPALSFRKVPGTGPQAGSAGPRAQENGARALESSVFYASDPVRSPRELLAAYLPRTLRAPDLALHWLAVDGKQPRGAEGAEPPGQAEARRKHFIDSRQGLLPPGVPAPGHGLDLVVANATSSAPNLAGASSGAAPASGETFAYQHVLSKEQQTLFTHIVDSVMGRDEAAREAALASVAKEAGLHQLVPYFVQFVTGQVYSAGRSLPVLHAALQLASGLLVNPAIYIEPYLHQLLPAILTCLVGRRLSRLSFEDHWRLREDAAGLVRYVCWKFGSVYPDLRPRVLQALAQGFLTPSLALSSHFGVVKGIAALGNQAVRTALLPHLQAYLALLAPELELSDREGLRRAEALRVFYAILAALARFCRSLFRKAARAAEAARELRRRLRAAPGGAELLAELAAAALEQAQVAEETGEGLELGAPIGGEDNEDEAPGARARLFCAAEELGLAAGAAEALPAALRAELPLVRGLLRTVGNLPASGPDCLVPWLHGPDFGALCRALAPPLALRRTLPAAAGGPARVALCSERSIGSALAGLQRGARVTVLRLRREEASRDARQELSEPGSGPDSPPEAPAGPAGEADRLRLRRHALDLLLGLRRALQFQHKASAAAETGSARAGALARARAGSLPKLSAALRRELESGSCMSDLLLRATRRRGAPRILRNAGGYELLARGALPLERLRAGAAAAVPCEASSDSSSSSSSSSSTSEEIVFRWQPQSSLPQGPPSSSGAGLISLPASLALLRELPAGAEEDPLQRVASEEDREAARGFAQRCWRIFKALPETKPKQAEQVRSERVRAAFPDPSEESLRPLAETFLAEAAKLKSASKRSEAFNSAEKPKHLQKARAASVEQEQEQHRGSGRLGSARVLASLGDQWLEELVRKLRAAGSAAAHPEQGKLALSLPRSLLEDIRTQNTNAGNGLASSSAEISTANELLVLLVEAAEDGELLFWSPLRAEDELLRERIARADAVVDLVASV